jgi:Glycosyl hydrolases family 15
MRCCRTAAPRRWSAGTARWTGCAFPGLAGRGGAHRLLLSTSVSFDVDGATATAQFRLAAGQAAAFALGHAQRAGPPRAPWTAEEITARLEDTAEGWRSWSAIRQNYEGPWRELVQHSGRVLQALTFAPTGAIVAAPTTSLPETVGGERNWDYRYTWVRDASLTMEALWVAACPDEANKFFAFLADAAASQLQRGMDLQIMLGLAANATCPSGSCRIWPGGGAAARSGWGTARGSSGSSTCTVSCSARSAAGRPAR